MKYKSYSPEIWTKIQTALQEAKVESQKAGRPPVAAFDADGTLWDTDLGESFFQYQIREHCVDAAFAGLQKPVDAWKHYRDWKSSGDPRPAYLWLAQINQGRTLSEVRAWAEKAVVAASPLPIFPDQERLFDLLLKNNVEIFIVTASVAWAVEPGAKRLGIDTDHVIGVRTLVENGLITEKMDRWVTYREAKLTSLLEVSGGRKPFLAVGNTMGDFALLCGAKTSLAVGAAPEGHELFATEEQLRLEASRRGWLQHRF